MLPNKRLTVCLMIASFAVGVASCETPGAIFPPAEDLRIKGKPVPPDDVLTSRVAGEKHDNAVEAWGEEGWAAVGRACRFWRDQGMPLPFECPAAPPEPRPSPPG